MFAKVAIVSALVSSAFATVFITSPVATTTFTAGQTAAITWQESNAAPLLAAWGNASVAIYAGNANQQTLLQLITPSINVSATNTISFTPDATIGPNGANYFIRIQSLTLTDNSTQKYPVMSFSALYSMASMTGTFNSTVSAEIAGQSTAPIGGSSSTAAPSTASSTGASTNKVAAASTTASSKSTTATGAAASSNGAMTSGAVNVWISALFGAVVLVLML